MSFVSFLGQVAKIGLGYGGGFLLLIAGGSLLSQGNSGLGMALTLIGLILVLFGVYSERQA